MPVGAVENLLRTRPEWVYHLMRGVGHVPMMETPDRFLVALLGWLDGVEAARAG